MKASARRAEFLVDGHRFEVILDVGGKWDGMAHVVDMEKLEPWTGPNGEPITQTVITGASWDGQSLTVKPQDIKRADYLLTVDPAAAALRRMTQD